MEPSLEIGLQVSNRLRIRYEHYKKGDSVYFYERSQSQKDKLLREEFYRILNNAPKDLLGNRLFRAAVDNADDVLFGDDKKHFMSIVAEIYKWMGLD